MKIINFCKTYLLSQKARLFFFIFIAVIGSAISLASPYILGDFIDELIDGADNEAVFRFCLLFSGINFFKILKDYISSILYTKMQIQMGYQMNRDALSHLQSLSVSFADQMDGTYLNERINGDCYGMIGFCLNVLKELAINVILFIVPLIVLYSLNKLILSIMLGFILMYIVIYLLLKSKLYRHGLRYRESLAKFMARLFEQINHVSAIKIYSVQEEYHKRIDQSFHGHYSTAVKSQRFNHLYTSFDGIVATVAQIALFVVGGLLVIRGEFTIGLFTVFSNYFHVMLSSCRYFFGLAASYQGASVSYERIKEILNYKSETNGDIRLNSIDTIECKSLRFSYRAYGLSPKNTRGNASNSEKEKSVIGKEFHFPDSFFQKGQIYSITGINGAGKTTLAKLLIGLFVNEWEGDIRINDIPIKELDMIHARKELLGYVSQSPFFVEDSILYNLTFLPDFSYLSETKNPAIPANLLERIAYYSKILNLEHFLSEKTLSFIVNSQNNNLSGGEKQKLGIMRVLLKNPDVMIFDEPTSALDKEAKKRFLSYLKKQKKGRIILAVTHDQELISLSDQVIELMEFE